MTHEPDIFGYLATTQISGVTVALLDDSTKNTFANRSSVKFWKGPISIWRAVEASRTYPHGLPIPESSKVAAAGAATTGGLQPTGSEIYEINAISFQNAGGAQSIASVYLTDGATNSLIENVTVAASSQEPVTIRFPIQLTHTLYLSWTSTEDLSSFVGYHTAGL